MNYKDAKNDSGSYVNGTYTTKNGHNSSGLNCPRGTRLYDPTMKPAVFFEPEDTAKGEEFRSITREVAPDILPNYAISNYGRVLNIRSGQVMKPNYRPNGYEYYCLSADNCKFGQKKYSTHRLVLKTFKPIEGMDDLQVNHVNTVKSDNYVDKIMEDGSVQSNLEWVTHQENTVHRNQNEDCSRKLNAEKAKEIRDLRDKGYSYDQIRVNHGFDYVSSSSIQNICRNKTYVDESYTPKEYSDTYKRNPANVHRLTDEDADKIRDLYAHGYKCKEIKDLFFENFSESTICDICSNRSHNR